MIFIHNEHNTDPHLNLALEEYALRNFDHDYDYLLFYINSPSIIIGRNQNTLEEINHEYVEDNEINVVRRISGGGAVYHDTGNLNFSFITNYDKKNLNNFRKFTSPIIRVLQSLGVNAELQGRNDIVANDRKISGNAQYSTVKRMFSHGTLLFDTDLAEVSKALDVKMNKIESKGHKSVRSRVANISEFLTEEMNIHTFREKLLEGLYKDREKFETYHLTNSEWDAVYELKEKKYSQWDWNFGKSPKFNIQRERRFDIGEIDLRLDVAKGYIKNLKIYGDFFGNKPIKQLEDHLQGARYHRQDLSQRLKDVDIEQYFGMISKANFLELLYGSDK
ncbi:lipoate--protein ligase [Aliifodinibius salicampi]|uniref:lipoate--protein ligase n=1 Tax=Fodinibius salicampi TaxID=1920655 RepID=A0ABT3PXF4_9BACT|nr:lipoate--protein ligase [Fodinibius salicampi]MCW9712545.1 lipoate--protein ligase [Fodinibius salicampi]